MAFAKWYHPQVNFFCVPGSEAMPTETARCKWVQVCVCGAQIAEAAKAKVPGAVTELAQLKTFYPAEAYHQQYLEKVRLGLR